MSEHSETVSRKSKGFSKIQRLLHYRDTTIRSQRVKLLFHRSQLFLKCNSRCLPICHLAKTPQVSAVHISTSLPSVGLHFSYTDNDTYWLYLEAVNQFSYVLPVITVDLRFFFADLF